MGVADRTRALVAALALFGVAAACVRGPAPLLRTISPPSAEPPASAGRPYDGQAVLAAISKAPPSQYPPQLRNLTVANRLAELVWTYDGRPYRSLSLRGSCGPDTCSLSVQGNSPFAPGERADVYLFQVDLATTGIGPEGTAESHDLGGYPPALDGQLEALVRKLAPPSLLEGTSYGGARWYAPPEFGRFRVRFTDGNEEGGKTVWITVDLPNGRLIAVTPG